MKNKIKAPKISVLLNVHNAEKYISESIESILRQSYKNFEFLILDDASTDGTWKIVQRFQKKDKRIKIIRVRKNLYIAKARNKLVKLAKGKYIAWQDADDISVKTRLEKQSKFLDKHPSVGIIGGYLEFFNGSGPHGIRKYATSDKRLRKYIFRISPVAEPVAMIRKECFEKIGYYNPKYPPAHDIEMSFRIGTVYKFANIPDILLRYREHPMSATFSKLKKMELDTLEIRRTFMDHRKYKVTPFDHLYNFVQRISRYFMPAHFRIWLFNKLRNSQT